MYFLNSTFILAVVFTTLSSFAYGQTTRDNMPQPVKQKGYVWSFSTREGEKNQFTQNLTTEFEEILVQSKALIVLNRTKFANMLEQRDLEKSVQELNDLPDSAVNKLKILNADLVIFGEIYEEKPSNLARITITFQNFDSEIIFKESQDAELSKIINSIAYRETQIKKLVNKINKAIAGKNKREFNKLLSRNAYKKGFGVEIYPYVYEFLEPGLRLSFQSEKRWGASIGVLTEQLDGVYLFGGVNFDCFQTIDEEWSLLVGPNLGFADFSGFFGFVDTKFRYKVFTAAFGIGYNSNTSAMIFPISFGFHLPIE